MPVKSEEIKACLEKVYNIAKKGQKELTEEELKSYFLKTNILEILGYESLGKDIRMEKGGKGQKRTDIHCIDEYGNVIFVIEFKKPLDKTNLKEHYNQLWENYILPLKAKYGIITNGLKLLLYERINTNSQQILDINLWELNLPPCETLFNRLQKPVYEVTKLKTVITYFNGFQDPSSRIHLDTDIAQKHFFDNFKLEENSAFGKLLQGTISLFNYQYGKSKFLTSAYDFWLKSYARKPEKVPLMWKGIMEKSGLTTSDEDLYKFMFCLETSYALFTKLMLAKACEDYKFPDVNLRDFIERNITDFRGDIPLVSWGKLLMELIRNMREKLVESIFEEDIFYWWTDKFERTGGWTYKELVELGKEQKVVEFSKYTAKLLFTLYKFDLSKIAGDPLGDLYQRYFDKETRKALGEFYTPKEVVKYIIDAVNYDKEFIVDKRLLDPACGSGTFLVEALKRYLKESESMAKEKGWAHVLKELCNKFHIVGFDIHPFACIMSQIHFTLILIPYYKKVIEEEPGFVLHRLPIFRTDSLIDETRGKTETWFFGDVGMESVNLKLQLPIKTEKKEFLEVNIKMPKSREAVSEKTSLNNIPEYFCALQAMFDVIKKLARNNIYKIDKEMLEIHLKEYLQNKNWNALISFLTPYGNDVLANINNLKSKFGDGRLVKSIEDIMLAGLLKNYVQYDFVVGNPPYVRIQNIPKDQSKQWEGYVTKEGNFDIYLLFIEKGLKWLNSGCRLGFINPNRFAVINSGENLRKFILEESPIIEYIDFRATGVFKDALNYPAILILQKNGQPPSVIKVCRMIKSLKSPEIERKDLLDKIKNEFNTIRSDEYRDFNAFDVFGYNPKRLNADGFYFMPLKEQNIFNRVRKTGQKLLDFSDTKKEGSALFEGSSTGNKKIFVVNKIDEYKNIALVSSLLDHKTFEIEKSILMDYVDDPGTWSINKEKTCLVFPYQKTGDSFELIPPKILEEHFRLVSNFFGHHEKELRRRKGFSKREDFYRYSAARSLDYYKQEKLLIQGFSVNSSVSLDSGGNVAFGPDIYGLPIKKSFPKNLIKYLLAIMNSRVANFFIKHVSVVHGNNYYKFEDRFIKHLPIKLPQTKKEKEIADKITQKVERILAQTKLDQQIKDFPQRFIEEYRKEGKEFDEIVHTFNSNYKALEPTISKQIGGGYNVDIGKKEKSVSVETKSKAQYVLLALKGCNVRKDEKVKILVPKDDNIIDEILRKHEEITGRLRKEPISKLEDEINELVYDLYKMGKTDKEVIEDFLAKF